MNNMNYDQVMNDIIGQLKKTSERKKLLMHSCCAPCSSACIERLKEYFDITIFFYNPNMDTLKEYQCRAEEQKRLCNILDVDCVIEDYNSQDFYSAVKGLEKEKEGGSRCEKCFYLRLNKASQYAREHGYHYFTTTLTVSPLKNARLLNQIGKEIEEKTGVPFLVSDFKKKNGYLRSIELSKEYKLYRQNYCGCEFSKNLLPNE